MVYTCRKYRDSVPFVGVYLGREPQLLPTDPRLVKDILGLNFQHFHDSEFATIVKPFSVYTHTIH